MRAATYLQALFLLSSGALTAMACNDVETTDPPPIVTMISSSTCETCFLHGGHLFCWGTGPEEDNPTGVPREVVLPGTPTLIAVGPDHSCAMVFEKGVYCWGVNDAGQLGVAIPADPDASKPIVEPQKSGLSSLATKLVSGQGYTCGLINGVVKCMGGNIDGTLGNGDFSRSVAPIAVPGLTTIIDLAAGYSHTCAIDMTNDVYCWGTNDNGQCGQDSNEGVISNARQVMGLPKADKLMLGKDTSCAHTLDGEIWCWGSNKSGQFGDMGANDLKPRKTPLQAYTDVKLGTSRVFGLTSQGTAEYWGLEISSMPSGIVPPTGISGVNNLSQISAGPNHGCGVSGGSVYCWGDNTCNQLGGVAGNISSIPVKVL